MKYITARVPDDIKNYLEDLAVANDWKLSHTIRRALEEFVQIHKEGKIEL